ncbi:hypothetical protein B0H15DRAFT_867483 [Mycena belliarum]|uniref:Secreted protein n=1 Tax=Mycena belliarum TaxID=1033014 RepID=A0AAD6XJ43_9AGAR|nr:hypothetical protein B0H15DRAFT_867483 [Mycena belliae]
MLRTLGATILVGPRLCARLLTLTDTRDVAPQSACIVIPKMPSLRPSVGTSPGSVPSHRLHLSIWPALPSIPAFPARGHLNVRCLVPPTQLSRVEHPSYLFPAEPLSRCICATPATHGNPIFSALRGWNSSSFAGLLVRTLVFHRSARAYASDWSCPGARPFAENAARNSRATTCPCVRRRSSAVFTKRCPFSGENLSALHG